MNFLLSALDHLCTSLWDTLGMCSAVFMCSYNWKCSRVQPLSNGGWELVNKCSLLWSWTENPEGQSTWFFRGLQWDWTPTAYGGSQLNNAPLHYWLAFSLVPLIPVPLPKITSMQALILDSGFFSGAGDSISTKVFRKDISPWLKKEMDKEKGLPSLFTFGHVLRIWCLQLWKERPENHKRGNS